MILAFDDWKFDIDIARTMEYSSGEAAEHCDCAYCRNFYASVDQVYPELRPFLAQFGIDIEAPDELVIFSPVSPVGCYAVSGKILAQGNGPLSVAGLAVYPQTPSEAQVNTFLTGEHFFLCTEMMDLPWVLDEPMDDVVSPANEPSLIQKILRRFLHRAPKDKIES